MKKHTLLMILILVPILVAGQIKTAQTQVNVIIAQAQSISITQPSVDIQLTQMAHYVSGNTSGVQTNHINVGSTTNYQISVRTESDYLSFNGGNSTIPVSTIALQATMGSDLTGSNTPASLTTIITPSVTLSSTDTIVIKNAVAEGARGYNVTYAIPATKTSYYLNKPTGTYSTTVIYTLASQ
jgi:uncharacterized membrane protein